MLDILTFLAAPFVASLILGAILGYLGLHVLLRKVIFVDLALAQIAAMGSLVAYVFGHQPGTLASFSFALGFAILGAGFFSLTRVRHERVPQEAVIGITYVVASAATLVIADRAPEGAEHIKELLAGTILWVSWPTVLRDLLVVALVGVVHYLLRGRFLLISEDPERAFEQGMAVRWWDFLFYATFGLVITISVEIGGVLMVFAYLVAPAIVALAAADSWAVRLAVAWAVAFAASAAGLGASYAWDLPSGPAIVCALGAILVLFGLWRVGSARRRVVPSAAGR